MGTASLPSLDALNTSDRDGFVAALGPIFEHSPWIAEETWPRRPFTTIEALHDAMLMTVARAPVAAQLALIRAHPDLAGKAALAKELTAESTREQAGAGLDRMSQAEYDRFQRLNAGYKERFGFPFIICVRHHDKASILAEFERRLTLDPDTERREALAQIGEIARLRLGDLLATSKASPVSTPPDGPDRMTENTDDALAKLTLTVRHDLECLDYPSKPWVRTHRHESGETVHDVVIVGGGQSGLTAAFGLMREKIGNILVIDENPRGLEGPWMTYARMITLRTPKYLTGPDLGVASLTFRCWWEAQYGAEGWAKLDKIPREEWMRYLRWYRETLAIPVSNDTKLTLIEPLSDGHYKLSVTGAGAPACGFLIARKVVLATGIQGGGEWHVPGMIGQSLPKSRYCHTSEAIDFSARRGQKIGILGGGASAFDNAQYALREGVGEVHVFLRKPVLPRVNPIRYMENAGFLGQFGTLDDATKYAGMAFFLGHNQPPTNDTFNRAAAYPGFRLHLGAPWEHVAETPEGVQVTTPVGAFTFDYVILSTGLLTDVKLRPELALVADDIALWRDRFTPPAGTKSNALLDQHPYLSPCFEFCPKTPEAASRLHGLFAFNYSALASQGLSASALSGLKFATNRLVQGISHQLFTDDKAAILGDYFTYNEEEFMGKWPVS